MKKNMLTFLLILFSLSINASEIDSLQSLLQHSLSSKEVIDIYNELAWSYRYENTDSSIYYGKLGLDNSNTQNYITGKGDANSRLGLAYRISGKDSLAIYHFNESLKIRSLQKDFDGVARTYISIGEIYRISGNFNAALVYFNEAVTIIKELSSNNLMTLADAYNGLGVTLQEAGQFPKSIDYFERSLLLYEHLNDDYSIGSTYLDLSVLLAEVGNYSEAIEKADSALELFQDHGEDIDLAKVYNTLGSIYLYQKKYENALLYYNKALKRFNAGNASFLDITGTKLNIGVVYTNTGKIVEALELYNKSLVIYTELDDSFHIGKTYHNIGEAFHRSVNYQKAGEFYQKGLHVAKNIQALSLIKDIYLNLYHLYEEQENYPEALNYQKKYIEYFKRVLEKDRIITTTNTNIENASELVKRQKTIEKEQSKNQMLINYIFLGLAILIIIIMAALGWGIKQRLKQLQASQQIDKLLKNQEIKALGDRLDGEEKERKRIAADLHDRVGSLLSTIKLYLGQLSILPKSEKTFKETSQLLDNTIDEVRRISHNMAAGIVKNLGLIFALGELVRTTNELKQFQIHFMNNGLIERLPLKMEMKVYRMIQEMISNGLKYSKASEMSIQLMREDNLLYITVEDDGVGFNVHDTTSFGIGLNNIHAIVHQYDGTIDIDSTPQNGTTFDIKLTIKQDD